MSYRWLLLIALTIPHQSRAQQSAIAVPGAESPAAAVPSRNRQLPRTVSHSLKVEQDPFRLGASARPESPPPGSPRRPEWTGRVRDLPAEVMAAGRWRNTPSGERVWRLVLQSEGAESVRVHFAGFDIGNGKVWILSPGDRNGDSALGPFSGRGIFEDSEFWTGAVPGDSVLIEYLPENPVPGDLPFRIDRIAHIFSSPLRRYPGLAPAPMAAISLGRDPAPAVTLGPLASGDRPAAACHLDVSCFTPWIQSSRAVAQIEYVHGSGTFLCTAFLVNTRSGGLGPYILTNNHCVEDQTTARTVSSYWNYQTSTCNGPPPALPPPQTNGADYLAGSPAPDGPAPIDAAHLDFAFLRLRENPPAGAYFLGWNTARSPLGATLTAIGHPHPPDGFGDDYKRITFADVIGGNGDPEFQLANRFGLTERGQSGSPWLSGPGYVAGLHNAGNSSFFLDPCGAANEGRLRFYGAWFADLYPKISNWLEEPPATCSFTVSPTLITAPAAGLSGTITVTTTAGCSWTATSQASWVPITSGASGSGSGTAAYTVLPNPSFARETTLTVAGKLVTIRQDGSSTPPIPRSGGVGPLRFVAVTPCRVADTRLGQGKTGLFGPPTLLGGQTRETPIPSSSCGIPASARAYSLNLTVVPAGPLSYLTVWPAGQTRPLVSTLNSFDGRIVANAAIVPAGANGSISIFVTDKTDVVVDINGYFTAASSAAGLAYVTNFSVARVSAIDTATNTVSYSIGTGTEPGEILLSPSGTRAYVANQASGSISLLDLTAKAETARIPVGSFPSGLAITPNGTRLYIGHFDADQISVLDTATNTVVGTIRTTNPVGVAISPSGARVYVSNGSANSVSVIDTATNRIIASIGVGGYPKKLAVSPNGSRVYVANETSDNLSVIDTATNSVVATIPSSGRGPQWPAVTPDGTRVYLTNRDSPVVSVIDTSTNSVIATIPVGDESYGIAISPDGSRAFVANHSSADHSRNSVTVINTLTNRVVTTILLPARSGAFGVVARAP